LLFFGTGAAVIGLLFLVVAFWESYLIVSALQKQLGQTVIDTTRLLEDAALEAVFLGIMSGVGYALISKGLDGIRREELLEAEGVAEVTFGRQQIPSGKSKSRFVARSLSGKVPMPVKRGQASSLHPGIKQRIAQPNPMVAKMNVQVQSSPTSDQEMKGEDPALQSASLSQTPEFIEVSPTTAPQSSAVGLPSSPDTSQSQSKHLSLARSRPPEPSGESTDAGTEESDQTAADVTT
ncbi:MAG: hypothetical protein OK474_06115, partial [Thaumarchaeota archaeon]|nr:hypothetical protein [Nitrososphaerota archaeon]